MKEDLSKSEVINNLAEDIVRNIDAAEPIRTELATSQRIIARVTDGIYREPWAAFRELIANAYDADATRVIVKTGAPDFEQVIVRDDGLGMSPETVAYILKSIGGSSKRTHAGEKFHTVSESNNECSPSGRPLIGKIGIGLFAVAQLTQHFQIITKSADSDIRTSATVKLRTHDEEKRSGGDDEEYVAGDVSIKSERVQPNERDTHGTTIVLYSLRPEIRRILQSRQRWLTAQSEGPDGKPVREAPTYHIGALENQIPGYDEGIDANLPWNNKQDSLTKFEGLVKSASDVSDFSRAPANLEHFDEYLRLIWQLSLSLPLEYIRNHPFDISGSSGLLYYEIPEKGKSVELLELQDTDTPRTALKLTSVTRPAGLSFQVLVDDVELRRPIDLPFNLARPSRIPAPMLMVASVNDAFTDKELVRAGGQLSFEAYLYWNSKIIPKETSGALIRVREASGTLFDQSFLNYQISEQNRLSQITAEIFVKTGLDGAINIDRESFNYSHPHFLFIQKWLHRALRLMINRNKGIAKQNLDREKETKQIDLEQSRMSTAVKVWEEQRGEDADPPITESEPSEPTREVGGVKIDWNNKSKEDAPLKNETPSKASAIAIVLEAYGVLSQLSSSQRSALIKDILRVLEE
ncbi:ATP-binding protein [Candidatus Thiodiazotropha sp. LNASS1]|uniref:ATP-binding protein n=1 Tax=Candidatus Thiodiazotropha sp. LNASS1 TaxID=3096260 RepID=UPI0034DF98CE